MATSRTSYGKLQRDRAKKERQQLKRDKRFDRGQDEESEGEDAVEEEPKPVVSAAATEDILTRVAELHRRFDDEEIDYDDFEEQKLELMAQLSVD